MTTTRLGDWYADLLFKPGGQVVLFVNERSLLPVFVPASPASDLVTRFQAATQDVLLLLGVPTSVVEDERGEMDYVRIGKTSSRRVLGSMTDFAFLLDSYSTDSSLLDVSVRLARTPCSPIEMKYPADEAARLLAGRA